MGRPLLSLCMICVIFLVAGCGNSDKGKNKGKDVPDLPVPKLNPR